MARHQHTAKCDRCGRTRRFRSAESAAKAAPHGRVCAAAIRREAREHALDELNAGQREKALEIVADGGVQRISDRVFLVISGLGGDVYRTCAAGNCNCAWGLRRKSALTKPCAHVGAVRLFGVTSRRAAAMTLAA